MLKGFNEKKTIWRFIQKNNWLFLGGFTILLNTFFSQFPVITEYVYSRLFFPVVRFLLDLIFGWLPFPLVYFFILGGTGLFGWLLFRVLSGKIVFSRLGVMKLLNWIALPIVMFYVLWGYNYQRKPLEELLGIDPSPVELDQLCELLEKETAIISDLLLSVDSFSIPFKLEDTLRMTLYNWSKSQDLPVAGRVRAYRIFPKGIFLRFSSSGLYFPFSGQGQVDAGLHPLDIPYVMTHEMSHGLGYGDEGTCNFLAYMATTSSSNDFIRYAGHLSFWRTLASSYHRYRPEDYFRIRSDMPQKAIIDIKEIYATLDKYPDIMPDLRNKIYDSYLRMQGIDEGIKNYNRVVMLVYAWRQKNHSY